MRLMGLELYETIFTGDFDCELLIVIMKTVLESVVLNPAFCNEVEHKFIADFLQLVVKTPNFDFSLEFLGKSEKALIS